MINIIAIRKGHPITFDSYTMLCCHFDSAFIDNSPKAHSLSVLGAATISSAQAKFGGGSALFDGNTAGVTAADSADFAFGIGDFTLDCWAYLTNPTSSPNQEYTIWDSRPFGGVSGFWFGCDYGNTEVYVGGGPVISVPDLSINTWHHLALVRASSVLTLYIGGVAVGSCASTDNFSSQLCNLGTHYLHLYGWMGYLDEFRISNGIARWTANFTPPTHPYPNN